MLNISRQNLKTYTIPILFAAATILMIFKNIHDVFRSNIVLHWKPNTPNITCYYIKDGNALPSVEEAGFESKTSLIFFHETSCRGGLTSRQACSVESATRAHPTWQINILFNSPVTANYLKKSPLKDLLKFPNVKMYRLHVTNYTRNTPLKHIFAKTLKLSKYPIEHAADMLRILTLNKYGGIYLDLDMMVRNPFNGLPPNWVVKQVNDEIATGVLSFAKDDVGRHFTGRAIKEISKTYDPTAWAYNGPDVFNRIINVICPGFIANKTHVCAGLLIYDHISFYPIWEAANEIYFQRGELQNMGNVYSHHLWNKHTSGAKIEKGSPYEKMAQELCPTIYELYGNQFGV